MNEVKLDHRMRTTVDIPDEQRAKLLELAARRGEEDISALIQDALDLYLREQHKQESVQRALEVRGMLSDVEADELERATLELRSRWR